MLISTNEYKKPLLIDRCLFHKNWLVQGVVFKTELRAFHKVLYK